MRDRTIRRRRLTLLACVIASLVLLTAYFGEGDDEGSGGLHSLQAGVADVFSPVQEGASRALKPVRDLFGWFGDTRDAKRERDKLKKEVAQLRLENGRMYADAARGRELEKQVGLDQAYADSKPLSARITGRSSGVWYSSVRIDKGKNDGVSVNDPVLGDGALVGRISDVSGGTATVQLITNDKFAVGARTSRNEPGTIQPTIGSTTTLTFDAVSGAKDLRKGDKVFTAGTTESEFESPFPRAIPIGTIRSIDQGAGPLDRTIKVTPLADVRRLDTVSVLLDPDTEAPQPASTDTGARDTASSTPTPTPSATTTP